METGDVHTVAVIMIDMDCKGLSGWSKILNRNAILGQMEICKARIVRTLLDEDA